MKLYVLHGGDCCVDKGRIFTPGVDEGRLLRIPIPLFLVETDDGERVLVDTGMHPVHIEDPEHTFRGVSPYDEWILPMMRPEDTLEHRLGEIGLSVDDVTHVVNTHLHFDHCGGNTYRDGDRIVPTFPRASYVFQRLEWADANAPNERTRGSYLSDDFAPLEAAGKLELIDESVEIVPGIRLDRIQGHTRGTQTVRVNDGRETLFFSSDFMPDRHHLPLPWIPSQDLYPLDTLAAKKVILPRAIEEGWIVGFTHDLPRFGRIRQEEGRYRFDELAD